MLGSLLGCWCFEVCVSVRVEMAVVHVVHKFLEVVEAAGVGECKCQIAVARVHKFTEFPTVFPSGMTHAHWVLSVPRCGGRVGLIPVNRIQIRIGFKFIRFLHQLFEHPVEYGWCLPPLLLIVNVSCKWSPSCAPRRGGYPGPAVHHKQNVGVSDIKVDCWVGLNFLVRAPEAALHYP
jgi:hypothetical protein